MTISETGPASHTSGGSAPASPLAIRRQSTKIGDLVYKPKKLPILIRDRDRLTAATLQFLIRAALCKLRIDIPVH